MPATRTPSAADLALLADPANFCQGHQATTCGACRDEYDPCDGHGEPSYCDGTCDTARIEWAEYHRHVHHAYPVGNTLTVEIHGCGTHAGQAYRVSFPATPDGEAAAVAYLTARLSTHAINEVTNALIPDGFDTLTALLHPVCEHGLSADLCEGPGHYLTAAQEAARGW